MFKEGEVIRDKKTGNPYMVTYVNHVCIFVVELTQSTDPAVMKAILIRDYSNWSHDLDMEVKVEHGLTEESISGWEYKPVTI